MEKTGGFPKENCDFTRKNGDFTLKFGDLPVESSGVYHSFASRET